MVVFVNLDTEDDDPSRAFSNVSSDAPGIERYGRPDKVKTIPSNTIEAKIVEKDRPPSSNNGLDFAAALTCYPIALSLASHVDLNDLYALSLTCQCIHSSLKQFSHQLVSRSLRCIYDSQPLLADVLANHTENIELPDLPNEVGQELNHGGMPAIPYTHTQVAAAASQWPQASWRLSSPIRLSSKIGACARDLVAPCRKCGTVVCRNCAAKPPSNRCLADRFRRLCKTCLDVPLSAHLKPIFGAREVDESPPTSSASSTRSHGSVSTCSDSMLTIEDMEAEPVHGGSFTSLAFSHDACSCATRGVYLCSTCGQNPRASDVTYKRVWTWRSRYSTHIGGGLGTGLGVGNQGQKCGRGENCLERSSSSVCWVEIDCSEGQIHDQEQAHLFGSRVGAPAGEAQAPDYVNHTPGYLQQEIEGIGGVVKKKVKKRVKVGATVWEYDDERESGKYLEREASETARSWCGWCNRVCLGEEDRHAMASDHNLEI